MDGCGLTNDGPNKRRMPLFLTPEFEQQWLSAKDEEALILILNYEISYQKLD
jgi:putative SOS response-associated peptidase YedK